MTISYLSSLCGAVAQPEGPVKRRQAGCQRHRAQLQILVASSGFFSGGLLGASGGNCGPHCVIRLSSLASGISFSAFCQNFWFLALYLVGLIGSIDGTSCSALSRQDGFEWSAKTCRMSLFGKKPSARFLFSDKKVFVHTQKQKWLYALKI